MPILRKKEINEMSPEDRGKKLAELRTELSRLRTRVSAGGSIENPMGIRDLRRTIARLMTVEQRERNKT